MRGEEILAEVGAIDGLIFHSDGTARALRRGRVRAANLTVGGFEADFAETMDDVARWLERIAQPGSPWQRILSAGDLARAKSAGRVGLIMGLQNMRCIADRLERIDLLHAAGLRVMQLTYNYRNMLGDGCLEPDQGGLSRLGHAAVERMNALGVAIDLSHVGNRTSLDAAQASSKPVLVTHANAQSVFPALRNKSDDVLRAVARSGGVVGASIYGPMCWSGKAAERPDLAAFFRNIEYVEKLIGREHIGLGTDLPDVEDLEAVRPIIEMTLNRFPAAIARYAEAFGNDIRTRYLADCASHDGLPRIVDGLLARGWSEQEVGGFLGGNFERALAAIWGE